MTRATGDAEASEPLPGFRTRGRVMLAGLRARMFGRGAPERIGGFRLIRTVGSGAFGDVYEAADDELNRRVALKVLRRSRTDVVDDTLARSLLREARALARLSHPNVVGVFGAGVDGDRIWIAMELVRGSTLRAWALEHPVRDPRDARRRLDLLLQAAHGLAAAHRRGILHRDFKPANALVGDDGRLRVADFGLARWVGTTDETTVGSTPAETSEHSEPRTRTGGVVGTPRYMSPEQAAGAELDARSDQYNFGVAAWELLTGTVPPSPPTSLAIPLSSSVPRYVFRALRRTLRREPARRFATMDALIEALERPPSRMRWGAIAVATAGLAGALSLRPSDARPRCDASQASEELQPVWNPSRRMEVAEGLRRSGVPYVDRTIASVSNAVDQYAAQWTEQHVALCRGAWHDATTSPAELDHSMRCLRDGLRTVDTLLARLDSAQPELAERATAAVSSLPAPASCAEGFTASVAEEVPAHVRQDLADAEAAALAGDDATAEALAERVAAFARDRDLSRVWGDALEISGHIGATRRDPAGHEQLQRAHELAVALGDDHGAFRRARMVAMSAATLTRFEQADDYLRHAEAALARTDGSIEDRAQLAVARCWVTHKASGSAAALSDCEAAASLAADEGVSSRTRRDALSFVATVYSTLGRLDEAEAQHEAIRMQTAAELGPEHPATARAVKNLAYVSANANRADEAIDRMVEYIALIEAARGPDDETLPSVYVDLGSFYTYARRFDEAEEAFATAVSRIESQLGLDPTKRSLERAKAQGAHARMVRTRGDGARAVRMLRAALSETDATVPEGHWLTVSARLELGVTLLSQRELVEAASLLGDVAQWLADAKHPRESEVRLHRGIALEGLARWTEARAEYQLVIALAGDSTTPWSWAATAHLAWIAAQLGEDDAARAQLAKIDAASDEALGPYAPVIAKLARGELAWSAGDRPGALEAMDDAMTTLSDDPYPGAGPVAALALAQRRRACLVNPRDPECAP